MKKKERIAIIGGGVSGSTVAHYLGGLGLNVTLFEKEKSLVSGPPFCHLHAGGNLYREISDAQCFKLLKQSIDFLRFYPYVVDYRPTVIALPITDKSTPDALFPRLKLLTHEYERLIQADEGNKVLGESCEYYKLYSREKMETLKTYPIVHSPKKSDEWMIPVAKNIDFDKVQFPLIMVQEYGINLFRLAAGVTLQLESLKNVTLQRETIVSNIQENHNRGWDVSYIHNKKTYMAHFDYLINAAGFRSGKIDDLIGIQCSKRMVEFKAAYISQWENCGNNFWPEIIFHGERGTPQGMGQFTPYPNGHFQLHGMTTDITLYKDGLVSNSATGCQPQLSKKFIEKIEHSWSKDEISQRTNNAIKHLSQFIPSFLEAKVGSKPLFGAQQIPGDDPTLRVAEVSFPKQNYARCEIVKVSSVLDMSNAIVKDLIQLGYLEDKNSIYHTQLKHPNNKLNELEITYYAEEIAKAREYPSSLSKCTVMKKQ